MKCSLIFILIYFIVNPVIFAQEKNDSCVIGYIANEGFLIRTKHNKILIDALFGNIKGNWCDQPDSSVLNNMVNGVAPFDSVDLVLITHKHSDHFNAGIVLDFMKNNREAVVICPAQVSEILLKKADKQISSRIKSIETSRKDYNTIIGDMKISGFKFRHGSWFETDTVTGKKTDLHEGIENIVYLIEADGFCFLHTGDCNTGDISIFKETGLFYRKIDVGFFDRVFLRREGMEIINKFSDLKNIVLMHIEPEKQEYFRSVVKDFPAFFVFTKKNENKIFLRY